MLVAVLVFCPNYAQIMLAFQYYATFLKKYSVHKLHNSQDKFVCKSLITRPPPLVFSSGGFEASIPGKLCRVWSILSVLASL